MHAGMAVVGDVDDLIEQEDVYAVPDKVCPVYVCVCVEYVHVYV